MGMHDRQRWSTRGHGWRMPVYPQILRCDSLVEHLHGAVLVFIRGFA